MPKCRECGLEDSSHPTVPKVRLYNEHRRVPKPHGITVEPIELLVERIDWDDTGQGMRALVWLVGGDLREDDVPALGRRKSLLVELELVGWWPKCQTCALAVGDKESDDACLQVMDYRTLRYCDATVEDLEEWEAGELP